MSYPLYLAVDLLDELVAGNTPSLEDTVRGAISLALHCQAGMEESELLETLADLERLAVGTPVRMDDNTRERMSDAASKLRRQSGVH